MRGLGQRYGVGALLVVALVLVLMSKADLKLFGWLTSRAGDVAAPALALLSEPLAALRETADGFGGMMARREELFRLREENRRLLVWQAEAARLSVENESLRRALRMPPVESAPLWTTARVVADPGGPFVRTLLLDSGADRGIENGMAVLDESGFVGRIVSVGRQSARVLLLTDLNSKIPVVLERSRDQAILEGTNDQRPELRFLPPNPTYSLGERVLTSGRGGVLPPGLIIGEIAEIRDARVIVRAYVDWDRLDHVAIVRRAAVRPPEAPAPPDLAGAPPLAPLYAVPRPSDPPREGALPAAPAEAAPAPQAGGARADSRVVPSSAP